jgi:hypothetical protein
MTPNGVAHRHFVNHGEMSSLDIGLNLRMPEPTAVLALAQMPRARRIVERRRRCPSARRQGPQRLPVVMVLFSVPGTRPRVDGEALIAEGVPVHAGYTLIKLPAFADYNRLVLQC